MGKFSSLVSALTIFLWGITGIAQGRTPPDVVTAEAAEAFQRGQNLFADEEYLKAAEAFEWAYRLAPHPDVLANIGYCYDEVGDYPRAVEFYRKYLANPNPRDLDTIENIKKYLKKLEAKVGDLRINCEPESCTVKVDNVRRGSAPVSLVLFSGNHTVEVVSTKNGKSRRHNIYLHPGRERVLDIDLTKTPPQDPLPPPEPPAPKPDPSTPGPSPVEIDSPSPGPVLRAPFWVFMATTIAGGITAGVLGGLAYATWDKFRSGDATDVQLKQRGENLRLGTNIAIGATAAAATTSIILAIVDVKRARDEDAKNRKKERLYGRFKPTLSFCSAAQLCMSF